MYCKRCGKEISDGSLVCHYCGSSQTSIRHYETKSNTVALVGFIFSFLISIVGLICSIIGYKRADECYGHRKTLALWGIIISIFTAIGEMLWFIYF